jgi:hypothetical protein
MTPAKTNALFLAVTLASAATACATAPQTARWSPAQLQTPQKIALSHSDGAACFTTIDGALVCPTRGTPLRSIPGSSPAQMAAQVPLQKDVPECFSGNQLVPCDVDLNTSPSALAEDQ